jgi:hypothetical protein
MLISPSAKIRQFLCLTASECFFMLISAFNAYHWDDMPVFNSYQCGKKMKSIYLKMTTFLATVCPTRVFCSRQINSVPFWFNSLCVVIPTLLPRFAPP